MLPGPQAWPCRPKATFASPLAAVGCQPVPAGRPAEALRDPVLPDPQRGQRREHLQVRQGEDLQDVHLQKHVPFSTRLGNAGGWAALKGSVGRQGGPVTPAGAWGTAWEKSLT